MIDLYAMKCPELVSAEHFQLMFELCSTARRERVRRFAFQRDKETAVLSECFARYCVSKGFPLIFEQVSFLKNYYGKPYLANAADAYFNISHAGDYIVCGLSSEPVGVDIEKIARAPLDVAEYCFSADEKDILHAKSGREADRFFYSLWTLKESYLKMIGIGLRDLLQCSFSVDPENGKIQCFIDGRETEEFVFSLMEREDYIMAVCGCAQAKLHKVDYSDFMDYLWHDIILE